MTSQVAFGRRGQPAKTSAPPSFAPSLTPRQRALLFEASEAPRIESAAVSTHEIAPWSRRAAFAASLAVTCMVAAFTMADAARAPLALAGSIFGLGSNLAANLWLTHKFCGWSRLHGFAAFALSGALLGVGMSLITARLGLGETELGYGVDAASGAGAALLYRLLAGRKAASPFS
jgi:hypothetical protein